jgi:Spy/CpxP family protein refolding chaperone
MQVFKDKKWQIVGAAVIIFVLGFLAGALSMNLYHRRQAPLGSASPANRFEEALKHLNLNGDQQSQVQTIINETRSQLKDVRKDEQPKVMEIRKHARERLQTVLTPEQWKQLQEQMRQGRARRQDDHSD